MSVNLVKQKAVRTVLCNFAWKNGAHPFPQGFTWAPSYTQLQSFIYPKFSIFTPALSSWFYLFLLARRFMILILKIIQNLCFGVFWFFFPKNPFDLFFVLKPNSICSLNSLVVFIPKLTFSYFKKLPISKSVLRPDCTHSSCCQLVTVFASPLPLCRLNLFDEVFHKSVAA